MSENAEQPSEEERRKNEASLFGQLEAEMGRIEVTEEETHRAFLERGVLESYQAILKCGGAPKIQMPRAAFAALVYFAAKGLYNE